MNIQLQGQRKGQEDHYSHGTIRTYKTQRDTQGTVSGCGSRPVCVFILKCSGSVQIKLEIPLALPNQNITIKKKSKRAKQIKGLFSVV